jgi:membrane protease YdiL (CAAX protease family)
VNQTLYAFGKQVNLTRELSVFWAAFQVLLICGIPTQLIVFVGLLMAGEPLPDPAHISLRYFALTSLFDTALVAILIRIFLSLSGETSREVFLGSKPAWREGLIGLAWLPVTFVGVELVAVGLGHWFPGLHNVKENPFASYVHSPIETGIFVVVVVLAGGIREELQRAFILHRFAQHLGGIWVGLTLFSVLFGSLHALLQSYDAAIAVGLLGVFWGVLYIRRRSAVAAMVNHAGFDAAQVLIQFFAR